jgi:hypothetical protein
MAIQITYTSSLTSLNASVGGEELWPSFSPSIHDYVVKSGVDISQAISSWTMTVNDSTYDNGDYSLSANDLFCLTNGVSSYYVRFVPNYVFTASTSILSADNYIDGYYTAGFAIPALGTDGTYYHIFDKNGVPIWYASNATTALSLHKGISANKVVTNGWVGDKRTILTIKNNTIEGVDYTAVNGSDGNYPTGPIWDNHDAREILNPIERRGNFLAGTYADDGFYFQEQTKDGVLVWDWHSKICFTPAHTETYHWNSVDVHPETGNLLVSLRQNSSVICIDYQTKALKWVLRGKDLPNPIAGIPVQHLETLVITGSATNNAKWLSGSNIVGEPLYKSFQYEGTCGQHDARFHTDITPLTAGNIIISVFDNQTASSAPNSRGVIYEINETTGKAYHRFSTFSDDENVPGSPTSGYIGSYTIIKEEDNSYTHAIDFPQNHPFLLEYRSNSIPVNEYNTADKVFTLNEPNHDMYRIIKIPTSHFNIDYLRNTAGMTYVSTTTANDPIAERDAKYATATEAGAHRFRRLVGLGYV